MQFSPSEIAKIIGVNKYGSNVDTFESLLMKNNREMLMTVAEILTAQADPEPDIPLDDDDIADVTDLIAKFGIAEVPDNVEEPAVTPEEAEYAEKRAVEKAVKDVNTAHGRENEDKLYKLWEEKHGVVITDRQKRFEKTYNVDDVKFRMVGYVDGVANIEGADFIIELKCRVGHLTYKGGPRSYELPQFLFYMNMSGIPRCVVFEEKDGKTREMCILFDEYTDQFDGYLKSIAAFVKRYETVANDLEYMMYYLGGSEYQRKELLDAAEVFA